jgi:hypothetical protein
MSLTQYGKIGTGTALTFPKPTKDDLQGYVARELGIKLNIVREASLAQAMQDPEGWLTQRAARLAGGDYTDITGAGVTISKDDSINGKVAEHYKSKLEAYEKANYPAEVAMAKANASSNRYLEELMEDLEIELPGGATIWASAAHHMADKNARFNMATGSAEVNEKAIYKRLRQAKKAKKAKRLAKANKA